jgi:SAM-dependent methyltransferase
MTVSTEIAIDPEKASVVGGRTLEVFAQTPRLNAWLYSRLANGVSGDVLEIGSGIGNLSRLIVANADRVVLSDMEPHYLHALRRDFAGNDRVDVVAYDLDRDPPAGIAQRRFDAIVAVNVIEHIQDDHALVGRLSALLKPGGRLLVYVPACPMAFGTLDRALGHFRRYTPASLAALLRASGLEPQWPRYMNVLGLVGWLLNGRLLRRERLSPTQVAVFEKIVWLAKLIDRLRLPLGLGVYTHGVRPV